MIVRLIHWFRNLSDNTPTLAGNDVCSDHYQLRHLIHSPIDAILHNSITDELLIKTESYLWKINQAGQFKDVIEAPAGRVMYSSGIMFGDDWYNDWVYSGHKNPKPYEQVIDASDFSNEQLLNILHDAEVVEFYKVYIERPCAKAYVWMHGKASVLDINHLYDQVDTRDHSYASNYFEELGWNVTNLQIRQFTKNKSHLTFLERQYLGDPQLVQSKEIQSKKNQSKDATHAATHAATDVATDVATQPLYLYKSTKAFRYFEGGPLSWAFWVSVIKLFLSRLPGAPPETYWCGTGYFRLQWKSESMNFKAFVVDLRDPDQVIDMYITQGKDQDLGMLTVKYPSNSRFKSYFETDLGLYIIGLKPPSQTTPQQGPDWYFNYEGPLSRIPVNGRVGLRSGGEFFFFMDPIYLGENLPELPKSLYVTWQPIDAAVAERLEHNGNVLWVAFSKYQDHLTLHFELDQEEIEAAFTRLTQTKTEANKGDNGNNELLQLRLALASHDPYPVDQSWLITLTLHNYQQSIELEKSSAVVVYDEQDQSYLQHHFKHEVPSEAQSKAPSYDKTRLRIQYHHAGQNAQECQRYLQLATQVVTGPDALLLHDDLVYYASNLLIQVIKANDLPMAQTIIEHFITQIVPHVGVLPEPAAEFASNALCAVVMTKDNKLAQQIFSGLPGVEFDPSRITHATLLYNLCCYLAWQQQKDQLLHAVQHSIRLGKPSTQFLSDKDFQYYWQDEDFLDAMSVQNR